MSTNLAHLPEPFNVEALIDAHLDYSSKADPHEIAEAMLDEIPAEELRDILGELLPDMIRLRISARRRNRKKRVIPRVSQQWKKAADDQANGDLDIMRERVNVPGTAWKFMGELERDDVEAVVGGYERRAEENAKYARAYAELLTLMKKRKASKVGDLPRSAVTAIFNKV
jgi:hypothetical protein